MVGTIEQVIQYLFKQDRSKKYEVKEIEAMGKEFDASFHQAVLTEPREGVEPGIVIEVLQKGYMYKDKVLRPSMVKVSE